MQQVRTALRAAKAFAAQPGPDLALLCPSVRFLAERTELPFARLEQASQDALARGTTAAEELICSGYITELAYSKALADTARCRSLTASKVKQVLTPRDDESTQATTCGRQYFCRLHDDTVVAVLVPSPCAAERFIASVRDWQHDVPVAIMAPGEFRRAFLEQNAKALCAAQTNALFLSDPKRSARSGASFIQGAGLALFAVLLAYAFLAEPSASLVSIHAALTAFFAACVALRWAALLSPLQKAAQIRPSDDAGKPVYSVLVTLLDEAEVIPGLIHHLSALSWPRAKLEIKLICEAGDTKTLDAIARTGPDARFEVITVPAVGPQTKPKALSYALPLTNGSLITLYDAEDRPHPMQLEEAWQRFRDAGQNLACLQAPLNVANAPRNGLTALFHLEYAGLFHRLLPWLAANRCPLPLGGTSNHFRRSALEAAGGWDPYNVTEDADLGYRLWRAGYRTETLSLPTLEDAPVTFKSWLPQRTRWFKGWMQTWLVHARNPRAMIGQAGLLRFGVVHLVMSGVLLSSLLHPLLLINAIALTVWILTSAPENLFVRTLAVIDWLSVLMSYVAFVLLGWQATAASGRRVLSRYLVWLPAYWLAMSWAAWRAFFQLFTKPFVWEKTDHPAYDPIHAHGRAENVADR